MPRKAQVDISDVINACCELFPQSLKAGEIPAYSDKFYEDVSKALKGKWSAHNVYIYLFNNRKDLKTRVFERLGIAEESNENVVENAKTENISDIDTEYESYEPLDEDDITLNPNTFSDNDNVPFDLHIPCSLWEQMKPVTRLYNNREILVMPPGVWSDIIADNFWRQYRMPCAFTFKKHKVSLNPDAHFLDIVGKCKSKKCNNKFHAIVYNEPKPRADLWLSVKLSKDTRDDLQHEDIRRQLRNEKRKVVGTQVLKEGAVNLRRKMAKKEIQLGDVRPPILYSNAVLRKLLQECRDEELGVNPKDGCDPMRILQKMKYSSPYIGSIIFIALDEPQLHYILPEQSFCYKEYCRILKKHSKVCIDSTAGLVTPLKIIDNINSQAIFLFEIVINFAGINLSVGQMLSASQDTNTILYFLNKWLVTVGIKPKEATSDYSKALLGAMSLAFNNLTLKDYVRECFLFLQNQKSGGRPAATFIRIDVAHFVAIFCRLKCFSVDNKIVKDFLIRCIALMVSCDDFYRFEEILLSTLTISIHSYDGDFLNSKLPSPAEKARLKLLQYISTEEHNAMVLIPDEESTEFKNMIKKMESTGLNLDPSKLKCFVYEEPDVHSSISDWFKALKLKAEEGMNVIHTRVNPYRLPKFFNHICRLAPEFVLWTAVMRRHFESDCIRATSCYVEGDFGDLKNNVLGGVHGTIRLDKMFRFHFEALQGQTRLVSSALVTARSRRATKEKSVLRSIENNEVEEAIDIDLLTSSFRESQILAHSSSLNLQNEQYRVCSANHNVQSELCQLINDCDPLEKFEYRNRSQKRCDAEPDSDLDEKENWRNKGEEKNALLNKDIVIDAMDSNLAMTWENSEPEDSLVIQRFEKPDSILKETENWRNRVKKEDALLNQHLKLDLESKESNSKKRNCEEKGMRKPSKFFRKCPDIEIRQNAPAINAGTKNAVMLLKNGSRFMQPIELNHRKYRVRNTCPFDSIAEILAQGANDNSEYLEHLENSNNFFCGFILEYIDSGAQKHVYGQRCLILKDFVDPQKPKIKPIVQNVGLHSFSVFCNLFDMWNFLIKNEPSMYRAKKCKCGFVEIKEFPILYVNHQIIAQEGYKEIEKALLINEEFTKEPCIRENCRVLSTVKTTFNAHVFIEADVRSSNDLKKSMTCKVRDFPVYLNLNGEKFRLTGIVIHNGINHYIALCRKIDGTWQMYNDTANKITTFTKGDYNKDCIPQAVIYIKISE